MTRIAFMALGATAFVLACIVLLEIAGPATGPGMTPASPATRVAAAPRRTTPPAQVERWVATILARPIFSASRRPVPGEVASGGPAAPDGLPRLSGVMVDGNSRRVIFAAANGGKPIVAEEGAHVGGFTVQRIEPDGVTVTGPGGQQVVHPTFEAGDAATGGLTQAPTPLIPVPTLSIIPRPGPGAPPPLEQLLRRGVHPPTGNTNPALGPPA